MVVHSNQIAHIEPQGQQGEGGMASFSLCDLLRPKKLSCLSQTNTFLFVLVLHLSINGASYPGNEFKLLIAGTGSMAKQTKHFCYLIETFALEGEVDFRAGILGCRINVAP